jgi:RNA polymerase sigma-70 factor (ECF subfamily)
MEDREFQDRRVVASVLQGDRDAFGILVDRYQGLVAGVAWRYGVPREEIEDVVSEAFVKAYRNLERYRPVHPFSTWLYRLAANHAVDHGRRRRRERARAELPQQLDDPRPGPEAHAERRERAACLRAALETLRSKYREVIFLVYVEGFNVEQTARVLGLPKGTIKSRLLRGRRALREQLLRRYPEVFGD